MNLKQFFEAVRQMEQKLEVNLPPLALVTPERMKEHLDQGLSLLPLVPPALPVDQYLETLGRYRDLLLRFNPEVREDLEFQAMALTGADPEVRGQLVRALLMADNGALFDLASSLAIAPEQLYFLGELALRPYLATYAELLESVLDFEHYSGGHCPVCMRRPHMGRIDGENHKYLHCQACETSWRVPRIACTACGCTETEKLGFFTVEGNDELRVEYCTDCGDYKKIINQRIRLRKLDFLVEDAATVHLDQLAEQEGYVRGGRSPSSPATAGAAAAVDEPQVCPTCYGTGQVPGQEVCPECLGLPESSVEGMTWVCDECGGTGRQKVSCPDCGGVH